MISEQVIVKVLRDEVAKLKNFVYEFIDTDGKKKKLTLLQFIQRKEPKATDIHFDYGHYPDMQQKLLQLAKNQPQDRFPLIAVFEDFRVSHNRTGLSGNARFTMIIVTLSRPEYKRDQRDIETFDPILRPVYTCFLKQLKRSGKFLIYDETSIVFDSVDRPHWGDPKLYKNERENQSYIFGSCLDGIELQIQLPTLLKTCQ